MIEFNKEIITQSDIETENVGYEFAKLLKNNDFVAIFGDLGVGKTYFTRGIAKHFTPFARVQSPTYTIVNVYKGDTTIYHFDLYRIDNEESLYSTGFFDYIEDEGIVITEWSEKIIDFIPKNHFSVTITKDSNIENKRTIVIEDKHDYTHN